MKGTPEEIKQAIQDLRIDTPITCVRVIGDRLELSLYGGRVLCWPEAGAAYSRLEDYPTNIQNILNAPQEHKVKELREAAKAIGILAYTKKPKAALIRAIQEWKERQ